MELFEMINPQACPKCGGVGYLENEGTDGVYIVCADCGAQTVAIYGKTEAEKIEAAKKVENLWNSGKAIATEPGE